MAALAAETFERWTSKRPPKLRRTRSQDAQNREHSPVAGYRLDLASTMASRARWTCPGSWQGVFAAWNDPMAFEKVTVDPVSHTVTWPGGIDLCPESLYQDVAAMTQSCCARDKPQSGN